jgi:succinate dehydrogenase / fumarate reductase cytochrome b subunit
MSQNNRPLSPHLQVYKLPLTGIISITHRMTGVILAFGLIFYVASFFIILQGNDAFLDLQSFLNNFLVRIAVWFFIYALFFHLCHGIRHLIWDVGEGFEKDDMDRNAFIELGLSFILTLIFY